MTSYFAAVLYPCESWWAARPHTSTSAARRVGRRGGVHRSNHQHVEEEDRREQRLHPQPQRSLPKNSTADIRYRYLWNSGSVQKTRYRLTHLYNTKCLLQQITRKTRVQIAACDWLMNCEVGKWVGNFFLRFISSKSFYQTVLAYFKFTRQWFSKITKSSRCKYFELIGLGIFFVYN